MKIVTKIKNYFLKLKLRNKLLLSFSGLIILSFGIFYGIACAVISSNLKESALENSRYSMEQTANFISYRVSAIRDVAMAILANSEVNSIVREGLGNVDPKQLSDSINYLSNFCGSLESGDIENIYIYFDTGLKLTEGLPHRIIQSIGDVTDSDWYQIMIEKRISGLWYPQNTEDYRMQGGAVSYNTQIKNPYDYEECIGIVQINMSKAVLEDILAAQSNSACCYIQDSYNQTIASTAPDLSDEVNDSLNIPDRYSTGGYYDIQVIGRSRYYLDILKIENTNWYLVNVIPLNAVRDISRSMLIVLSVVALIIVLFSYLLALVLSNTIMKRIMSLTERMKTLTLNNMQLIENKYPEDEVGILISGYNFMVDKIRTLIEKEYITNQRLLKAEYNILKEQINPHFLYNTLNLLLYLASENRMKELQKCILALSRFYKLGLNNGNETVTIRDELYHVQAYMDIIDLRFNYQIQLVVNVPEEILNYSVIKIVLQPIVENAVTHGIQAKGVKEGVVTIEAYKAEEEIVLTVHDNGVGIPQEKIRMLLSDESGESFGLKSTDTRIKLFYGNAYGLQINSRYGEYTQVVIRIPLQK